MEERRRNKRIGLSSKLLIKRLDAEGAAKEVDIDVVDVSKTGVGFLCSEALESDWHSLDGVGEVTMSISTPCGVCDFYLFVLALVLST